MKKVNVQVVSDSSTDLVLRGRYEERKGQPFGTELGNALGKSPYFGTEAALDLVMERQAGRKVESLLEWKLKGKTSGKVGMGDLNNSAVRNLESDPRFVQAPMMIQAVLGSHEAMRQLLRLSGKRASRAMIVQIGTKIHYVPEVPEDEAWWSMVREDYPKLRELGAAAIPALLADLDGAQFYEEPTEVVRLLGKAGEVRAAKTLVERIQTLGNFTELEAPLREWYKAVLEALGTCGDESSLQPLERLAREMAKSGNLPDMARLVGSTVDRIKGRLTHPR